MVLRGVSMDDMNKAYLEAIVTTLNSIEVHGKDNLSKLLGCINALESILAEQEDGEKVNNG